ncbi:MAG TPA: 16S rRNA (cytosine(967)-C(5))-methyltransferase RsmB [Candidatus Acidoferrum sp.]|nr:16S rRNA (cytosine(967)-C(5))-methyltransferase RsmB [Candidatus Acidoferrum sp.]
MNIQKPREIAARALLQRESGKGYIEETLDRALVGSQLTPEDRGLTQEIAYGVVRWQGPIDWLISRRTQGREQKATLRVLLRMAIYQLFWLTRIPDHAAVNETVELARAMGCGPQAGFVNAVLRGFIRERDTTESLIKGLKQNDVALAWSHPAWLCERWQQRLGRDRLIQLLDWNNSPPKTFARVNLVKADVNKLREQWAKEGVEAKLVPVEWARDSFVYELVSHPPLASLPSFIEGKFYIQDPSTLLAVMELEAQPGETILDLCAAPGGKTNFIAERMKNTGRIIAHDTSEARLQLVTDNATRLGVTNIETTLPGTLDTRLATPADRILLDAPCSNTGVMRRRVDLRWRIRAEELQRLRTTQLDLLRSAVLRLKPGGTLVYSTCSLEPEENEQVVREFLNEHPHVHFQRERALTPWEHGVDGAYVARFVRGN